MSKKLFFLISILVLSIGSNALAYEDLNPPYWAGAEGSTYAVWEFDDDAVEEVWLATEYVGDEENHIDSASIWGEELGTDDLAGFATWDIHNRHDSHAGRSGVVEIVGTGEGLEILGVINNYPRDENRFKRIRIQAIYQSATPQDLAVECETADDGEWNYWPGFEGEGSFWQDWMEFEFIDLGGGWWHVTMELDLPETPVANHVGVDLGINRPAVTSDNQFFGERRWKDIEQRNFRLKRSLQAKGTRSAKRHLKKLSGRVNRFRKDCDHVLSKKLVQSVPQGTMLILEDLTDIRDRVQGRRKQRRLLHSWSFNRLQTFLAYKGNLHGVSVGFVDPRYTSQKCSRCGHRESSNRKTQSRFVCKKCGFQHNADLNAAKNIRRNYLVSQGISLGHGVSVNHPIVATSS